MGWMGNITGIGVEIQISEPSCNRTNVLSKSKITTSVFSYLDVCEITEKT